MRFFCFFLFCIQFCGASLLFSAILPHQGRVLVSGEAFDGNASFRFALVDPSTGNIVWNHTGTSGVPETDLVLEVKNGFYKCPLGDTTVTGMAELSSQFFTYYNDLKLRVWFNDGVNGLQRLGSDQSLPVVPYAMNSSRGPNADLLDLLAGEINSQSASSGIPVSGIIQRMNEVATNATADGKVTHGMLSSNVSADLNRTITRDMLPADVLADLNRTITRDMLPADVLADLNRTSPVAGNPIHSNEVIGTSRSYIFVDEHNASTQLALPSAVLHRGKEYTIYSKLPNLLITGGTKEMETRDYALLKTPRILEPSTASFVSDGTNWRNISVNNHNQLGGILIFGDYPNDLNSSTALVISENMSIGSIVG